MFIKICGLQTHETVAAALDSGADAVGFIFAPGSPRTVSAATVKTLIATVPPSVETVGVFRNQPLEEVFRVAREAGVSTVQLHGAESLADVTWLEEQRFRTLRAFSAPAFTALSPEEKSMWRTKRLLLDAVVPGSGEVFDAGQLAETPTGFWLLAGGLTVDNVAGLVNQLHPTGVDVSSGVESSRGVKDPQLIRAFIAAARG